MERPIREALSIRDLERDRDAVWSLLLHSGYLGAQEVVGREGVDDVVRMSIPNREVAEAYRTLFRRWLRGALQGESLLALTEAILCGDAEALALHLEPLLVRTFAHLDFGGPRSERVYQAFIVGLLVHLQRTHRVHSNPESGFGRADVLVIPHCAGAPGAVLELKVVQPREQVEAALDAALGQIQERDYAERLREAGAAPIHTFALVFDGKRAYARAAPPSSTSP